MSEPIVIPNEGGPGVAGLRWHATYVPPGTVDPEDTDAVIESGWYVTGHDPEQPDGPMVQMLVEHTVFRAGSDEQPEQTAQAVAHALSRVDEERDALRADMGIRQGALNDVLGRDRSQDSPTDYYDAVEDVAELKRALALAEERIAKTLQALRLDGKWSVQHGALAVRSERDRVVAERDALRAQLAEVRTAAMSECLLMFERALGDYVDANGDLAAGCFDDVMDLARTWVSEGGAPVSESVPATPEPARDRLSVVAHPGLDFPDCLIEFARGEVFAYRRAIEECEGWAQDLDRAYAAPYRDVARWLEGRVEWFRERAAQAQAPSGVDLPEVEAAPAERRCQAQIWPSWAPKWIACNAPLDEHGSCKRYGAMHDPRKKAAPSAAASADTTPREFRCDQPAHSTIPCERCEPIEDGGAAFLGARYRRSLEHGKPRVTGTSSDALALVGVGAIERVPRHNFPADEDDLAACERTYEMAPPQIQARMLPMLEEYRACIAAKAERYGWHIEPVEVLPNHEQETSQ